VKGDCLKRADGVVAQGSRAVTAKNMARAREEGKSDKADANNRQRGDIKKTARMGGFERVSREDTHLGAARRSLRTIAV
jgi:hypothetical protein